MMPKVIMRERKKPMILCRRVDSGLSQCAAFASTCGRERGGRGGGWGGGAAQRWAESPARVSVGGPAHGGHHHVEHRDQQRGKRGDDRRRRALARVIAKQQLPPTGGGAASSAASTRCVRGARGRGGGGRVGRRTPRMLDACTVAMTTAAHMLSCSPACTLITVSRRTRSSRIASSSRSFASCRQSASYLHGRAG